MSTCFASVRVRGSAALALLALSGCIDLTHGRTETVTYELQVLFERAPLRGAWVSLSHLSKTPKALGRAETDRNGICRFELDFQTTVGWSHYGPSSVSGGFEGLHVRIENPGKEPLELEFDRPLRSFVDKKFDYSRVEAVDLKKP